MKTHQSLTKNVSGLLRKKAWDCKHHYPVQQIKLQSCRVYPKIIKIVLPLQCSFPLNSDCSRFIIFLSAWFWVTQHASQVKAVTLWVQYFPTFARYCLVLLFVVMCYQGLCRVIGSQFDRTRQGKFIGIKLSDDAAFF